MAKRNKENTEILVYPVSPLPIRSASANLSAIGSCAAAGLPLQFIYTSSRDGGIGRRTGLKIRCQ